LLVVVKVLDQARHAFVVGEERELALNAHILEQLALWSIL
jgi:hypothetical protein